MKADVYRNLHKNCWSVRVNGQVWYHCQALFMHDVKFVVQPAGNRKVRETGRKNVHAFVRGQLGTMWEQLELTREINDDTISHMVKYNPYKNTTFVDHNGNSVEKSEMVFLDANGRVFREHSEEWSNTSGQS